ASFASEQLDLTIDPESKGFRVITLRSPLYVRGTFNYEQNFIYKIWPQQYSVPGFTYRARSGKSTYYRLETFLLRIYATAARGLTIWRSICRWRKSS
ncbi:hypothetical protein, partial [Klebsiella pneumoniae]|uniref:hypothetical protein n=1 Tax=Klebsiella pneumoniae TaxID=573 RepID=UPI00163D9827